MSNLTNLQIVIHHAPQVAHMVEGNNKIFPNAAQVTQELRIQSRNRRTEKIRRPKAPQQDNATQVNQELKKKSKDRGTEKMHPSKTRDTDQEQTTLPKPRYASEKRIVDIYG